MFPAGPTNEVQLRHVYAGPCEEARAESFALRRSLPPPSAESKRPTAAPSSAHARPKVASSPPTREPGPRHESGAPQTSPAFPISPARSAPDHHSSHRKTQNLTWRSLLGCFEGSPCFQVSWIGNRRMGKRGLLGAENPAGLRIFSQKLQWKLLSPSVESGRPVSTSPST